MSLPFSAFRPEAAKIQINDLNCPFNNIQIDKANAIISKLSVLGQAVFINGLSSNTIEIDVDSTLDIQDVTVSLNGLLNGQISLKNNRYDARLTFASDLSVPSLTSQAILHSGNLACIGGHS